MKYSLGLLAFGIVAALGACSPLTAPAGPHVSDDRLISSTAGVLGVSPADVTVSNTTTDGATNTFYVARTAHDGATYACTINGGTALSFGMTNPPSCNKKS